MKLVLRLLRCLFCLTLDTFFVGGMWRCGGDARWWEGWSGGYRRFVYTWLRIVATLMLIVDVDVLNA